MKHKIQPSAEVTGDNDRIPVNIEPGSREDLEMRVSDLEHTVALLDEAVAGLIDKQPPAKPTNPCDTCGPCPYDEPCGDKEDYMIREEEPPAEPQCTHGSYDEITNRAGEYVGYHCNYCLQVWDKYGLSLDISAAELSRKGEQHER